MEAKKDGTYQGHVAYEVELSLGLCMTFPPTPAHR